MFGIGEGELAIIVVFGFLLFGPDKLPQMGRTIGRAIRQFRETQEKMTAVVQSEIIDPVSEAASAPVKPKKAAATDDDSDADEDAAETSAPAKKETFAERRARLAAERAAKEAEAAADDAEGGKSAPAEDAPADEAPAVEPEPDPEQVAEEAPEPEVLTTEDLYARRPRKRAAAPAAEAEAAPVEDESKGGEQ